MPKVRAATILIAAAFAVWSGAHGGEGLSNSGAPKVGRGDIYFATVGRA